MVDVPRDQPANNTDVKDARSNGKLKKEMGLWDVYCISTGAMFSSGFFLLPGLATAQAGPATVLAYLLAGLLIVPSMLSMAELSTALPRAGGAYYFLDRSLGPLAGTIGGIGTWLSLVLKAGFALLGMGAYLAILPGFDRLLGGTEAASSGWMIKALAAGLTVLFAGITFLGAKKSTSLQSWFVVALLGILAFFIVQGLWFVFNDLPEGRITQQYTPFFHESRGLAGFVSTIGLVFVSYAGLTQVASVSEEVDRPERNLPLGMILSLITATAVYVVGIFIMVAVLDAGQLRNDYTPVATAAESFFTWLPGPTGLILIVIAALAAFASTGNAGILAASRFPLAMARDKLAPEQFARLSRFDTPTAGIVLTAGMIVAFVLLFSAENVAKLASAFLLLVFGFVNVAIVVMRESRIESYDPGFKSPLYPWTQVAGMFISGWLIIEMGWLSMVLCGGVILLATVWYVKYARPRVDRSGAINHVFERLGRKRHAAIDTEFREILKEKGLRDEDPFDEIVARADVLDFPADTPFDEVIKRASQCLARRVPMEPREIEARFRQTGQYGGASKTHGVLPHFRTRAVGEHSEMVLVRAAQGMCVSLASDDETETGPAEQPCDIYAAIFLVSGEEQFGQHLRILAQVAGRLEDEGFINAWRRIEDHQKLKEVLLRDERFLPLIVGRTEPTRSLTGKRLRDIRLAPAAIVAMVRRGPVTFTPNADTRLEEGDRLTIIGDPGAIQKLYDTYVEPDRTATEEDTKDQPADAARQS
ncbi:MAG: amino acid permease [Phycisphaerae bacterium]